MFCSVFVSIIMQKYKDFFYFLNVNLKNVINAVFISVFLCIFALNNAEYE